MSTVPTPEPSLASAPPSSAVRLRIDAKTRDLGGFTVRRLFPVVECRRVGPFVFFDHMGPAVFAPESGIDVRPHPHIGLATVTYLFEGEILHRDSLGSSQAIVPGDINWMTAGQGITHSERSSPTQRRQGSRLSGLQLWIGLPQSHEETEPTFVHHPAATLPELTAGQVRLRVLAGTAYGVTAPVQIFSPLFYVDAQMPAQSELPLPSEYAERAVYVVAGSVSCGAERAEAGCMLVLSPGASVVLRAESAARVSLIGGAPLDGDRHIYWNFVSSSTERIEQAKRDWQEGRFPKVPGDEIEYISLP